MTSMLSPILAALSESDVVVATGTFSSIRFFGFVTGVTLSLIVFNGQINEFIDSIDNLRRSILEEFTYQPYTLQQYNATELAPIDP